MMEPTKHLAGLTEIIDTGYALRGDSFVRVQFTKVVSGKVRVYVWNDDLQIFKNWRVTVGYQWNSAAFALSFLIEKGYTFVSEKPQEEFSLWQVSLEPWLKPDLPKMEGPFWGFYELKDALEFRQRVTLPWRQEKVEMSLCGQEQPVSCLWMDVEGDLTLVHSHQPDVEVDA